MSDLPVLLIIPYDLLNMASGNPMVHVVEDGTAVLVRIPTAEELVGQVRAAHEQRDAEGLRIPFEPAQRICKPLPT